MAIDSKQPRDRLDTLKAETIALSQNSQQDRQAVRLDQQSVGRLSRMDALQQQAMGGAFLPSAILEIYNTGC